MAGDGAHRLMPDPHPTGAGTRYCLAINLRLKSLLSHKLELDKDLMSCVSTHVYVIHTANNTLNYIHTLNTCTCYVYRVVGVM